MQRPTIRHRVTDAKKGVTVEILAYRKLNKKELAITLQEALHEKGKKLKPGTVLRIFSFFS
jgi:hypothetical protein